jgi:hypothetical protein
MKIFTQGKIIHQAVAGFFFNTGECRTFLCRRGVAYYLPSVDQRFSSTVKPSTKLIMPPVSYGIVFFQKSM